MILFCHFKEVPCRVGQNLFWLALPRVTRIALLVFIWKLDQGFAIAGG